MTLSRDDYLARWSQRHDGIVPRGPVRLWLGLSYAAARPFVAARVPPDLLSLAAVAFAGAACVGAWAGERWLLAAAAAVAAAALLDGLDGAVALCTGRDGPWGAVLDSVCDRISDALLLLALYLAGAPAWAVLGALILAVTAEYARSRAAGLGARALPLTVGERPARVAVVMMFLLAGGVYPDRADRWAAGGAYLCLALGAVALPALLASAHRRLRTPT